MSDKTRKKVELHTAYVWTCDDCGRDNFQHGLAWELSEEDREWFREEFGDDRPPDGQWVTTPDDVECQFCGAEFDVERDGQITMDDVRGSDESDDD